MYTKMIKVEFQYGFSFMNKTGITNIPLTYHLMYGANAFFDLWIGSPSFRSAHFMEDLTTSFQGLYT